MDVGGCGLERRIAGLLCVSGDGYGNVGSRAPTSVAIFCSLANGTGGGDVSDAMLTLLCERSGWGVVLLRNRAANVGRVPDDGSAGLGLSVTSVLT